MSIYRKCVCVAGGLLFAALSSGIARANLIVNGDFETPIITSGATVDLSGGASFLTGWTILGSDVGLTSTAYSEVSNGIAAFNSASGKQSVDLTGSGNSGPADGLTQSIPTVAGTSYLVSFAVGSALSSNGATYYQPPGAIDELSINSGPQIPFASTPVNPGHVTWTTASYQFKATGPSTSISFFNGTPLATDEAGIDNVSVTAVPEPMSITLLVLCGAGLVMRRRGLIPVNGGTKL